MKTTQFTVGKYICVADKMDVFDQLFVSRKLLPIMAAALPSGMGVGGLKELLSMDISVVLPGITSTIANLPEQDVRDLLVKLLTPVRIQQEGGYAPMIINGSIMFQDIELPDLMKIAFHSGKFSLQNFFAALPSNLSGAAQTQSDQ